MPSDASERSLRLGLLASHPVQYQAPWFRALAKRCELHAFFAHRQDASQQARAGYGVEFEWDVDLLNGYSSRFLQNVSPRPNVYSYFGCNTPEIGRHIASDRYDAFIVMGWYLLSYWQAVIACKRHRIPVLVRGDSHLGTPRSALKRALKSTTHPLLLNMFDGFLSVGSLNKAYLVHYGVANSKIAVAPHSVDNAFFAAQSADSAARDAARRSLGGRDGERIALFVGRLIALKRPGDIVRAAALLNQSGERVRVAFAGDGPLAATIRDEARSLGVPITLLGFRNQRELPSIYAASDFLVVPSEQETWGLVANEAMASGIPVVVSHAVGCAPDLITHGSTGFVYPAGDVAALARAMAGASRLARTPELRDALQRTLATHNSDYAADSTLQFIRRLIA